MSTIKPVDLKNLQVKRKKEGCRPATVDQEISQAKAFIIEAFTNNMISGDTLRIFKSVKKTLKRNSNARDRILSRAEFENLMEHVSVHLKPMLAAGYWAGMRKGEILSLTWGKVDLRSRLIQLEAEDTKDAEPRTIPICDELYGILKGIPRNIHDNHVFLYKGKPVANIRNSLTRAFAKAKILYGRNIKDGFIFHDLRHTFNTNMRKAGVDESVIMEITGHSTREMFDRYNTVDVDDNRQAVDHMALFLAKVDQTVDQMANNEKE